MSTITTQNVSSTTPAGPTKPQPALVRYAFLGMTGLSLSFSAIFSTIGILVLKRVGSRMTELQQVAIWFHIFVYILYGMLCFLGVYACVVRRPGPTALFTSLVIGQILFSIGSGALCLYLLFNTTTAQPWDTRGCLDHAFDTFTKEVCRKSAVLKGFSIAAYIVMWLAEIGMSVTIVLGNAFLSEQQAEAMRSGALDPKYDLDEYDF
ncbi:hypothetical protein LshimejAT787_0901360 [Lyophyllum shimeji]|uniref:Uncharacterized protein n=1 Tax=Lyophyllum shimeji TaxID=47721 RepID=A0A9P3PTD7_LYOSH|nr:hypothetical protein LshimejAT787_0901360 [Lyophyllum shimeji]